jgi:SagB-type dehydrogenase family enzyme
MKLQSASCQVTYWDKGHLRIVNYLSGRTFSANPEILEVIQFFLAPRTIRDALLELDSYSRESIGEVILQLIEAQLLLQHESAEWYRDSLVQSEFKPWLPGGEFHFLTKDAAYFAADWTEEQITKALPTTPAPPQFKRIDGAEIVKLPVREPERDSYFETLYARRTHRSFSKGSLQLETVATLLKATWGVQGYVDAKAFGQLPLKTSPSGGARHPGEVYVMALRVGGLDAGMYHYHAEDHLLEKLPVEASPRIARAYCADQPYVADAAALFIMTAVFSRTSWKYPHPRAYRVVLLDAGHLGQTFCLTATRMGLAPFSTAALKDTLIEKDLGIDGVSESVLYVVGVGRPAGHSKDSLIEGVEFSADR